MTPFSDSSTDPASDPVDDPGPVESRPLRQFQILSAVLAVVALLVGFLASVDVRIFPLLTPFGLWVGVVHLVMWAGSGGAASVVRTREVDRRRWHAVEDPLLTSAEREWAHKEAENDRRVATTLFFLAPVALAYALSYLTDPAVETPLPLPAFLGLLTLGSFLVGFAIATVAYRRQDERRNERRDERRDERQS